MATNDVAMFVVIVASVLWDVACLLFFLYILGVL